MVVRTPSRFSQASSSFCEASITAAACFMVAISVVSTVYPSHHSTSTEPTGARAFSRLFQDDQELVAAGRATGESSWPILFPVATEDQQTTNSLGQATIDLTILEILTEWAVFPPIALLQ
jgi:hypothetical protein